MLRSIALYICCMSSTFSCVHIADAGAYDLPLMLLLRMWSLSGCHRLAGTTLVALAVHRRFTHLDPRHSTADG